jgi:lipid II:glycine glycyltransferase (peptidoglycan interpeptide bridge formation enzyme)
MFGVAPKPDPGHPMYGLYRFKSGFGGHLFHRMGCWDYPLNMGKYEQYVTAEMHSQGYHLR